MDSRLERESRTIEAMIEIYCKNSGHSTKVPCHECSELLNYAKKRLEACKFGSDKPVCARCRVHCYEPDMRRRIKEVMRTAGPKMLLMHPILTVVHFLDSMRY